MPYADQPDKHSIHAEARALLTNPQLAVMVGPEMVRVAWRIAGSAMGITPRQRHRPANTPRPTSPEGGAA